MKPPPAGAGRVRRARRRPNARAGVLAATLTGLRDLAAAELIDQTTAGNAAKVGLATARAGARASGPANLSDPGQDQVRGGCMPWRS